MIKNSLTQKNKQIPEKMLKLGRYLKTLREELGLSMHEVSRRSDLTPSYISKIEAANTFKSVNIEAIIAFSVTYGVPVNIILENTGFLKKQEDQLPGLASYLRMKYEAPYQAIRDMEIVWEIIQKKYITKSLKPRAKPSYDQWSLWK